MLFTLKLLRHVGHSVIQKCSGKHYQTRHHFPKGAVVILAAATLVVVTLTAVTLELPALNLKFSNFVVGWGCRRHHMAAKNGCKLSAQEFLIIELIAALLRIIDAISECVLL